MVLTTLLCCLAVVAFDVGASTVSKMSRMPYGWFSIPQALVYVVMGYVLYRSFSMNADFYIALLCAATCEVTIGWWLSAKIGPGKPSDVRPGSLSSAAWKAVVVAWLAGLFGGFIAKSMGG